METEWPGGSKYYCTWITEQPNSMLIPWILSYKGRWLGTIQLHSCTNLTLEFASIWFFYTTKYILRFRTLVIQLCIGYFAVEYLQSCISYRNQVLILLIQVAMILVWNKLGKSQMGRTQYDHDKWIMR